MLFIHPELIGYQYQKHPSCHVQNNTQLPREPRQNKITDTREILEHKSFTYHWLKNNDKYEREKKIHNLTNDFGGL